MQRWLQSNSDILHQHSIFVPIDNTVYGPKCNAIIQALVSGQFAQLVDCFSNSTANKIFICHEGLSNHFLDFSASSLSFFRELTGAFDTTLIVVTRNRDDWTKSYFNQCVINPPNASSELWGTDLPFGEFRNHPKIKWMSNYSNLISELSRGFGADELVQLNYETDNWHHAIMETIGVPVEATRKLDRVNDAVPEWSIAFIRHLNCLHMQIPQRNLWIAVLELYLNTGNIVLSRALETCDPATLKDTGPTLAGSRILNDASELTGVFASQLDGFRSFLKERFPRQ